MLTGLVIQDIVLIERLSLDFSDGLTVLTGETGAGKSILLDALGLALGRRSLAGMVRPGASQGVVTATFEVAPDHPAWAALSDQDFAAGDQLLLRRTLGADGKSRAFINDQPVSIGLLRAVGDHLVEIHGQGDEQGLMDAATHRALLDEFAGLQSQVRALAVAYRAMRDAGAKLSNAEAELARARAEQDYIRHVTAELAQLGPRPGEESELAATRLMLRQGEKLGSALAEAAEAFRDGGVVSRLRLALRAIERVGNAAAQRFDPVIASMEKALSEAQEAEAVLETATRSLDLGPERLNSVEERLFELRAAARKHNVAVDELANLCARLNNQLAALDRGEAELTALKVALTRLRADYVAGAEGLAQARQAAGLKLADAIAKELKPLKLGNARFEVCHERLDEANWGEHGLERVSFLVATNPGQSAGAIAKIASGGELSRFMLALKVVLAGRGDAGTLIFDEVDRGIGGATADAVGERLAKLAARVQVLVVTHSPQVAARGNNHWRIGKSEAPKSKKTKGGNGEAAAKTTQVVVRAEHLTPTERQEEIARMLAGARITLEARAAAASLLDHGNR